MNSMFIPDVRVGEPGVYGGVAVFPLFTGLPMFPGTDGSLDYAVAKEAMAAGMVEVREMSEDGSVGTLLANNCGDQPVLFVEGEELKGAKQNRAVSSSILIAGKCQTRIPVCCVQRGKWTYSSQQFNPGSCCPPSMRYILKQSGDGSIVPGYFCRQVAVWREIRRKHQATRTRSEKENMSDTLETHRETVEEVRGRLQYPEGATGIAVVMDGKVASVDIFDKSATLAKLWDRLVQGVALDALEVADTGRWASTSDILVRLYKVKAVRWQRVEPAIGLGEAYCARDDDSTLATALTLNGSLVHLSMSAPI